MFITELVIGSLIFYFMFGTILVGIFSPMIFRITGDDHLIHDDAVRIAWTFLWPIGFIVGIFIAIGWFMGKGGGKLSHWSSSKFLTPASSKKNN